MQDTRMPRRQFVTTIATAALAAGAGAADFHSAFPAGVEQAWLGRDYWSNPMQEWRLKDGRMECIVSGGDRNVFLLTREISASHGDLQMRVRLGRLAEDRAPLEEGFAGFRVGIRGAFSDYRDSAVRGHGLNAGVDGDGRLFIGKVEPDAARVPDWPQEIDLQLTAAPAGRTYGVVIEAFAPSGGRLARVERKGIPGSWLSGGVALVCSAGPVRETPAPLPPMEENGGTKPGTQRGGNWRFSFGDWQLRGSKLLDHADRAFGPIYFAMHTLSRGVLKLTAQMAPIAGSAEPVRLQVQDAVGGGWKTVASSPVDALARTAAFRVPDWNGAVDLPYRVVYDYTVANGARHEAVWEGTVRRDPRDKPRLVIGALTCNNDFGFPHSDIVASLRHFRPDLLLFTGDQIYERVAEYGIQRAPLEPAVLDYLRKWLLFGWGYGDLFRDTPVAAMPDDHDVYHGNVWGAGGQHADASDTVIAAYDPPNPTKAKQDAGGFTMPAEWVNVVQRTQTSHLPDPYDPTPVSQGITVYYTSMLYGGVSFALLEDRKWKSAPRAAIPWAGIQNGWAQNPEYHAARHGDADGAELLGARQLKFLEEWAADWSGGAFMKAVISQTIFANVATLPKPANNDDVTPKLPILKPGEYPEDELLVQDHDSNGWPQTPRNTALRVMRKALAFHVGGDQHLGSTVQYGIDDWNDGPFAICTPAISNIWPRRWYPPQEGRNRKPGSARNMGEFVDGFGNKVTVHAVSNPMQFGASPAALHNRAPGYGILEIDRETRRVTLTNWPRFVNPARKGAKPYPGWPITIHQLDNGFNAAKWKLPPVELAGIPNSVVQVIHQGTGETAYTVRPQGQSFTPRVFEPGLYTVRLFDPDGKDEKVLKDQRAGQV